MARPWRIQFEGAVFHVMSRGVGRRRIFPSDEDYAKFLELAEKAVEKFELDVFAFVLMTNHYHLLLRINKENLSKALAWIQTSYAIYHNHKYKYSGHLFQGRYKSMLVGEESYWKGLSAYIHLNPIRAGMVDRIEDYPWSSYLDYTDPDKAHKWVKSEEVLEEFGNSRARQVKSYRQFLAQISGREKAVIGDLKHGFILGSKLFVKFVREKFAADIEAKDSELTGHDSVRDEGVGERVLEALSKSFNVKRQELVRPVRHKPNLTRDIGIYFLHARTSLSNKEIGRVFGIDSSAVTKASERAGRSMQEDTGLKKKIEALNNSIFKTA